MAGTIMVSGVVDGDILKEHIGFGYNTLVFEVITDGIRDNFQNEELSCEQECFDSLEYDTSICLWDIDKACFNVFERACDRGLRQLKETKLVSNGYQATQIQVDGIIVLWEELLAALRRDPRYLTRDVPTVADRQKNDA